jgi:hypothetical protein
MNSISRKRWYVFYQGNKMVAAPVVPQYVYDYGAAIGAGAAVGPFVTRRGAKYFAALGYNNPQCRDVQTAEYMAKRVGSIQ